MHHLRVSMKVGDIWTEFVLSVKPTNMEWPNATASEDMCQQVLDDFRTNSGLRYGMNVVLLNIYKFFR